jgi:hypothetical protein
VLLTDSTQPTGPLLRIEAASRNGFAYAFTASRDRIPSGDSLVPATSPNANILEYRVTRRLVSGSSSRARRSFTPARVATTPSSRRGRRT